MEKKTEHYAEELWKLAEGTDTEIKWYQVGKKGKVIDLQEQSHDLRSEHLKENRTSKLLELVSFRDSITKYIIPENVCKCDLQHAVNLSKSGAKVKGIYKQLSLFQEEYKDTQVKNIIIHVGTNHLSRDNPDDTATKIYKLLVRIQYQFPDTVIFYSGIPPKFGKTSFGDINYINESAFNLCARSQKMQFISHNSFAVNGPLKESLFYQRC